jgi:hypothetical protein
MQPKGVVGVAVGTVVGAAEVVAVGILLAIGFHIGSKLIEKVESRKLAGRPQRAR